MNKELQSQISQIIAQIMVSVGEVKDFSMEQLPDIAQQYVTYGIWSSAFYSIISLLFVIAFAFAFNFLFKIARRGNDDELYLLLVLPAGFSLFPIIALCHNIHQLILVLTAPKVWFLLEIKNLLQ
jgi:hypothetical protein